MQAQNDACWENYWLKWLIFHCKGEGGKSELRGIVCLYPAAKCHRKKAAVFAQYAEFQIGFNVATSLEILHTSF